MATTSRRRGALATLRDQLEVLRTAGANADTSIATDLLHDLGGRSRWLLPVAYAGHTIELMVGGVLLLLRNWRLLLLELVPAIWLAAITWDWRVHVTGELPRVGFDGWAALGVLTFVVAANLLAYWCNATFAFVLTQQGEPSIRVAFDEARRHAWKITVWALTVGVAHGVVSVAGARWSLAWFGIALGAVAIAQMYAIVALPVALAGLRKQRYASHRQRVASYAVSGALTSVAIAPGFVLNRIAIVLIGLGWPLLGGPLLAVAIVLQVAGTSSARAVKLAAAYTAS